jgi:hypothetical protein
VARMEWTAFFFDGNRYYGLVDSPQRWRECVAEYGGDVELLLRRTQCAGGWETGERRPTFTFRIVDGETLDAWAARVGMDLRAVLD